MSFFGLIAALVSSNSTSSSAPAQATQPASVSEPLPPAAGVVSDEHRPTSRDLSSIIGAASERSRIDADFIASVIRVASGNNPYAVSRKGAQGLMQLMPQTAHSLGVKDPFDPAENVDAGVRYLHDLLLRYNGDAAKALAAYWAGPQRVEQYNGVPPDRETHAFVARVISDYNRKKIAQAKQQATRAQAAAPQP
jgi:soluble lytic murein transglycosylase-like protein